MKRIWRVAVWSALLISTMSGCRNYVLRCCYVVNESSSSLVYKSRDVNQEYSAGEAILEYWLLPYDKLCISRQLVETEYKKDLNIPVNPPLYADVPLFDVGDSIAVIIIEGDERHSYAITPEDKSNLCWLKNYQYDRDLDGYVFIIDDDFLEHLRTTQSEQE